jgi:catechol-2,3-dioxygenase
MCFVTYDDEHHRVAFIDAGRTDGPVDAHNGLAHIAFTYGSLDELLETYAGLERDAIVPALSVNHGPTTSLYYRDPDGNQVELQVDNFATVAEGHAYMQSPAFAHNPVGVFFDPAELWRRVSTGEPVEDLLWHD